MIYDAKCFTLAAAFMEDHPELLREESTRTEQLAQAIQTAIDDKIEDFENEDNGEYQAMRREYLAERARAAAEDPRSREYAERVMEAADNERKRIREEGA